MSKIMGLPVDNLLKPTVKDMTVWEKGWWAGYKAAKCDVMRIVDDADKKAGDKTYIVLGDGRFYSQAKYIKEKMLELLSEQNREKDLREIIDIVYAERGGLFGRVMEIIEKHRGYINYFDLDAETIAAILSDWLAFENEVLALQGDKQA